MNFFTDNDDIQFHFHHGVAWDRFVPLWEEGFRFEDGPRALAEARELYEDTLKEAGAYAAREIAPTAREIDEQGVAFVDGRVVQPPALLRNIEGLKRLGVMGLSLPRDLGGANFPLSAATFLFEILSRACTNTLLLYAFHQGPAVPIARFGTREQAERWVPRLASGEISGSVAMTEPDAGSDVGNVSTTAVPEGDHWRITGRKQFITNGCGDVSVVLARTEPGSKGLEGLSLLVAPRVENGRDNFRVARPEKKMVIRGSATCELSFEGSCARAAGPARGGLRRDPDLHERGADGRRHPGARDRGGGLAGRARLRRPARADGQADRAARDGRGHAPGHGDGGGGPPRPRLPLRAAPGPHPRTRARAGQQRRRPRAGRPQARAARPHAARSSGSAPSVCCGSRAPPSRSTADTASSRTTTWSAITETR